MLVASATSKILAIQKEITVKPVSDEQEKKSFSLQDVTFRVDSGWSVRGGHQCGTCCTSRGGEWKSHEVR